MNNNELHVDLPQEKHETRNVKIIEKKYILLCRVLKLQLILALSNVTFITIYKLKDTFGNYRITYPATYFLFYLIIGHGKGKAEKSLVIAILSR